MINLLPPDDKADIRYARLNAHLLRVCLIMTVVIAGIGIITLCGLFYMKQSIKQYQTQVAATQEDLKSKNLEETQKSVEDISNNLKLTTQVLSRQVLFSDLIKQIGAVMPANTSLSDLKIGKVEGGIDLSAVAANREAGTQVLINLQDKNNKLFEKADLLSLVCSDTATEKRYPCTVSIRALFNKNNNYRLIKGAQNDQ